MIDPATSSKRRIPSQQKSNANRQDDVTCYVCGRNCVEGWFACIHEAKRKCHDLEGQDEECSFASTHEAKRKVYLCGTACALMYFDVPNPPAHDHQARHEYYRARAAILQATRPGEYQTEPS